MGEDELGIQVPTLAAGRRECLVLHAMSHCSWQQPQEGHPHLADKEGKTQFVSRRQEGAFVGAQPFPQA